MLRREGARLNAMDPRVLGWVRAGVSDAVLLAAMSAAQERRSSGCAQTDRQWAAGCAGARCA